MKSATLGMGFLAGAALCFGCSRPVALNFDPDKVISLRDGQIVVATDSPFLKHLESGLAGPAPSQGDALWVVGQIIALANPSDSLKGSGVRWAELDSGLSRSLGLNLSDQAFVPPGEAYGLAELPKDYAGQMSQGEKVSVCPYGLRRRSGAARVERVVPLPGDLDWTRVLLRILPGREWYPGNNCEIAFPLRSHPATVPTTALLHEGNDEYVLVRTSATSFRPERIVLLDTGEGTALVVGPIVEGTRIVARGSILLKPYLHQLLRQSPAATRSAL